VTPADEPARRRLVDALGLSAITAQVLLNRGLRAPDAAAALLEPRLDRLASPLELPDMSPAIARLWRAIRERTPVVVYGDYDADGVTATALLLRALRPLGAQVSAYLPDRRTEGYGLHAEAVRTLAARGAGLIVAVDCGVTAIAAAATAQAAGCDLIVLDHHEPPAGSLPAAVAIVDPKRAPSGTHADFCAAGLAFQACRALYAEAGASALPPGLLGLAALGTVADAVDLRRDNRILVALGLQELGQAVLPGLAALTEVAAVRPPLGARDISHGLAPRLNAAGRLARADEALRLLLTNDPAEARALAERLEGLNRERRAVTDAVLAAAIEEVERDGLDRRPALVLAHEGWHPGVIGIVASQLVERYYRPAVLIALEAAGGKGSARSIPPLHLVEALGDAAGHLAAYGGHAMAAGLSMEAASVPAFREAFIAAVAQRLGPEDLQPLQVVDAEIPLDAVTPALAAELQRLAPYGRGHPEPVFLTRGLRAAGTRLVGDGAHLRLVVTDGVRTVDAIAFQRGEQVELLAFTQAAVDLVYTVAADRWRGNGDVQLVVTDLDTPGVDVDRVAADAGPVLDRLFERAEDYLGARLTGVEYVAAFHTKVVGVTFEGRQAVLPLVRPGERLHLVRDPRNPRDPHAIKVVREGGEQLGFLRAGLAARLAPSIDAGARYLATATALTGGGDRAWGLNIYLEREAFGIRDARGPAEADRPAVAAALEPFLTTLARGRPVRHEPREIARVLGAGGRAVARLGPGGGLLPTVAGAAAALLAAGRRPVLVVVPRSRDADAWGELAGSWLRDAGIRAGVAHGALPASAALRVGAAFGRGDMDVVFASWAWTVRATPAAGGVIVVVDALATGAEVDAPLQRYGRDVRLIAGPMAPAIVEAAAARLETAPIVVGRAVRENLRVVDRRGRVDEPIALNHTGLRPEKVLIVTAGPHEAVAVARTLRVRHPDAADRIAYHHAGLPSALRRVLEDLFAAGRLTALAAGSHFVDPAAPADVTRLIAAGLGPDRLLMAEALAVAGLGGRPATIELSCGSTALAAALAELDTRFPSRELLVRCYRGLRATRSGPSWVWSVAEEQERPALGLPPEVAAAAMEILVEAGVLSREDTDGDVARYAFAEPETRVDLTRSLRYQEGERERAGWADLREWISGPSARILADLAAG
jgi:single-stranded-DNA-specific exonuclease